MVLDSSLLILGGSGMVLENSGLIVGGSRLVVVEWFWDSSWLCFDGLGSKWFWDGSMWLRCDSRWT